MMQLVACIGADWTPVISAAAAAIVAATGVLIAKHRPADARTRAGDRELDEDEVLAGLDDYLLSTEPAEAADRDPGAAYAARRARLQRAADELRRRRP